MSGLEQLEDRCLLSAVVAEHVFYNNSSFNGNTVAASVQDDNAIAPDSFPVNYVPNGAGRHGGAWGRALGNVSRTVINDGNYNSFPGVTSPPNGELIAVYRAGINHIAVGATINYQVSTNGGQTWSAPQVLATPAAGAVECRDPDIATLSNGSVMVNYWQYNDTTEAGLPYVIAGTYSSATGSMTWAAPVLVTTGFPGGGGAATGKVMELANGTLLLPVSRRGSGLAISTDQGQTWTGWVMPSSNTDFSESNGVIEPNGEIIFFMRDDSSVLQDQGDWRTVSTDGGQTWLTPIQVLGGTCVDAVTGALIDGYNSRPSPVLLPSGAIAMLAREGDF